MIVRCAIPECDSTERASDKSDYHAYFRGEGWDLFMGFWFCATHTPDSNHWDDWGC